MDKPIPMLLFLFLAGTFLAATAFAAPQQPAGRTLNGLEQGQRITVTGIIDRISETEIVINDSLFALAPDSGVHPSSFSKGQVVEGQMDDKGRIRSLRRIQIKDTANLPHSDPATKPSATLRQSQPIHREGGVWKN